jgi:O-methyltransferase
MEPRFFSTVDGNHLSRVNLLRFIREFCRVMNFGPGYYLEFGVLNGSSMIETYGILRGRMTHLFGFDTFAGLPSLTKEDGDALKLTPSFEAGNFKSMPAKVVKELIVASTSQLSADQITLEEGLFSETLPRFDKSIFERHGPCMVVNVDCDLYSSSCEVFRFLEDVVTTGTWLLLDDYWCYRGSPKFGQRRAFEEWSRHSSRLGFSEYSNYNGFSKAYIVYEK